MKGNILDVDYTESEGSSSIRVFVANDGKHETVTLSSMPYFLVLPKGKAAPARIALDQKLKVLKDVSYVKSEIVKMVLDGEEAEMIKIYMKIPSDIPKARDFVKHEIKKYVKDTYEYTINLYRRFLIDNDLDGSQKVEASSSEIKKLSSSLPEFKTLAFDLESYEEAGKQKIIMISVVSRNKKQVISYRKTNYKNAIVVKDEKAMIEEFIKIIKSEDPDIILTYNGDQFDFDLLTSRSQELKVALNLGRDGSKVKFERRAQFSTAKIKGRVHIDLYSFIVNTLGRELQTETLSLDAVASEILGDEKISMEYEEILETWRSERDLARLAEYCEKDSDLTLRLGNMLLPQIYTLANLIGQTIFDTSRMHYGQMAEWYLVRRAAQENIVIPNPPTWNQMNERRDAGSYAGGYVKEPIPGVHESITVLDFRSLYPSVIATFNISPETLNHKKCKDFYAIPEYKHKFCKERKGFVSSVIKEIIERRIDLKKKIRDASGEQKEIMKNQIQAFKITANAMYGMFGFTGAKWYCKECAESSAALGRHYIKTVIESAEKAGFIVIYSDTDSIFIRKKDSSDAKQDVKKFLEEINKSLPGLMELDLQGFYKRGIFIPKGTGAAKKRYALSDEEGNLTIRGLEKVRKDWSMIARSTQEKVLNLILDKNDPEKAIEYVRKIINDVKSQKVDVKDFLIRERLTKPLSEYKQIGPHVIAARKMKERGLPVGQGMSVLYAITKGSGSISERAEPASQVKISEIDGDYYITNQIIPSALRVLQALGVNQEKLLGSGLERFLPKKKKGKND